jgi:hypothetical protein
MGRGYSSYAVTPFAGKTCGARRTANGELLRVAPPRLVHALHLLRRIRAADYGLPAKPAGFAPGVPGVTLGPHTNPVRRRSDAAIDAKVRSYSWS